VRTATVRLYRAIPPFVNRVTVGPITVRGFRDFLKRMGDGVFAFGEKIKKDALSESDVWKALGDVNVVADLADIVCVGQPRGFFKVWSSNRNLRALMRGVVEVETMDGIARIWGLLDWSGERVKKGGGFGADIETIARMDQVSPLSLFDAPMQDFLERCDLIKASAAMGYRSGAGDDPTLDPEAEPTPLPNRTH
jgi:hypothetical protein